MKLHYLGPAGTFSEQAAAWFAQNLDVAVELEPEPSISDAISRVASDAVAVVPYYNLIDGLIPETPDRVCQNDLRIRGALRLPIRIAAGHGPSLAPDAPVFSHEKALAQCADYLAREHPGRERVAVPSTSEGITRALAADGLALASAGALNAQGLSILLDDATNNYLGRPNYTEFVLLTTQEHEVSVPPGSDQRCLLVCDPQDDRPGLLADMLAQLAFFRLNLARIHARPARWATQTALDPLLFFIEITGGLDAHKRDALLSALSIGLSGSQDSKPRLFGEYALHDLSETA